MKYFAGVVSLAWAWAMPLAAEPVQDAEAHWPQWRGPHANGVSPHGSPPTEFGESKNVKWRVKIPGKGHSTPIVWGDRIFLTTAVPAQPQVVTTPARRAAVRGGSNSNGLMAQRERQGRGDPSRRGRSDRERRGQRGRGRGGFGRIFPTGEHAFVVMALDRNTGKKIWERTAVVTTPHEGYHRQYGSFASNSPVTDGEMLYAYFGSRGIFAYDLEGDLKWKKSLPAQLHKRNAFGEGTAPVIHGDVLLLNCDQEAQSFILALNKRTGEQLWHQDRDELSTWTPPLVVEHAGRHQVVVGGMTARSYDLETGKLIWQAAGMGTNAIPAPVQTDDMVILMTGHRSPNLLAIKLGGEGDLTEDPEYIKWTNQRGNSYTASPVLHNGILYFLTDRGTISAFEAATGKIYYHQQRLPEFASFKASPIAAGEKLYLASEGGDVFVLKLGKTYEALAVNNMGDEMFVSSPIVAGDDLFLRSQDELFCISKM